ncbi:MAG: terpene cyclase/mutase family protein [Planctomycetia bacterium]|nr:terpene cyclase/mutase family protein [Planctomycetia bacterium]
MIASLCFLTPPPARRGSLVLCIALLINLSQPMVNAQVDQDPQAAASAPDAVETETENAVKAACQRGLDWLVATQHSNGSWGSEAFRGSVAITATATQALVSAGNTPVSGTRALAVRKGLGYLMASTGADGLIAGNEQAAHGPMYGHAFASLVLAELYGETADDLSLAKILDRSRALIESTQNDEGGWRYDPYKREADGSVTASVLVALRGLRNSGFKVSEPTVKRAIDYLQRLQNTDGGFRYQSAAGPSAAPRTAATLFALEVAGVREGDALDRGFAWLAAHPVQLGGAKRIEASDGYTLYGLSLTAAALWQRGTGWQEWYSQTVPQVLGLQHADGFWADPSSAEYGTAAALSVLQMPNNLTPLFQRETQPQ